MRWGTCVVTGGRPPVILVGWGLPATFFPLASVVIMPGDIRCSWVRSSRYPVTGNGDGMPRGCPRIRARTLFCAHAPMHCCSPLLPAYMAETVALLRPVLWTASGLLPPRSGGRVLPAPAVHGIGSDLPCCTPSARRVRSLPRCLCPDMSFAGLACLCGRIGRPVAS